MKELKNKTALFVILMLTITIIPLSSQNVAEKDITGYWFTPEKDCIAEIYLENDRLYGKLDWFKEDTDKNGEPIKDEKNPNEKLQNKPLLKKVFLINFKRTEKSEKWKGGKIYNPNDGRSYKGEITQVGNDSLIVRGYIGISLLGKNSIWTRVPKHFFTKK